MLNSRKDSFLQSRKNKTRKNQVKTFKKGKLRISKMCSKMIKKKIKENQKRKRNRPKKNQIRVWKMKN